MAIFGFLVMIAICCYITFCAICLMLFDGAFGKRELKWWMWLMIISFITLIWYETITSAPFMITMQI